MLFAARLHDQFETWADQIQMPLPARQQAFCAYAKGFDLGTSYGRSAIIDLEAEITDEVDVALTSVNNDINNTSTNMRHRLNQIIDRVQLAFQNALANP